MFAGPFQHQSDLPLRNILCCLARLNKVKFRIDFLATFTAQPAMPVLKFRRIGARHPRRGALPFQCNPFVQEVLGGQCQRWDTGYPISVHFVILDMHARQDAVIETLRGHAADLEPARIHRQPVGLVDAKKNSRMFVEQHLRVIEIFTRTQNFVAKLLPVGTAPGVHVDRDHKPISLVIWWGNCKLERALRSADVRVTVGFRHQNQLPRRPTSAIKIQRGIATAWNRQVGDDRHQIWMPLRLAHGHVI